MMIKNKKVEIKVPGSSANLGPGFDSFGLALPMFLTIRLQLAEKNNIKLIGGNLSSLPNDETNLIYRTIQHLFHLEKQDVPQIALEIESDIPLSRGVGSSGAAIIGGLLAANQLLDNKKTMEDIFQIAVKLEGHADNVGASLFGGFVVTAYDGVEAKIAQLPFPADLKIMLAIPNYTLATSVARGQIPKTIPLKDVAFNIGHAALLISYITTGQLDKIPSAMKDKIHQPYRQSAVTGLERILEETDKLGLFSSALSGAGPTILFLVPAEHLSLAKKNIERIVLEEGMDIELKILSIAQEGASIKNSSL